MLAGMHRSGVIPQVSLLLLEGRKSATRAGKSQQPGQECLRTEADDHCAPTGRCPQRLHRPQVSGHLIALSQDSYMHASKQLHLVPEGLLCSGGALMAASLRRRGVTRYMTLHQLIGPEPERRCPCRPGQTVPLQSPTHGLSHLHLAAGAEQLLQRRRHHAQRRDRAPAQAGQQHTRGPGRHLSPLPGRAGAPARGADQPAARFLHRGARQGAPRACIKGVHRLHSLFLPGGAGAPAHGRVQPRLHALRPHTSLGRLGSHAWC